MNFDLKALTIAAAANEKCDLLVVLVAEPSQAATSPTSSDPLSSLMALAIKQGDLPPEAGKSLSLYQPPAIAARHVLLVSAGDGSASQVRKALAGAGTALNTPARKRAVVCFSFDVPAASVTAAVQAVADATYVFSATKPSAKPSSLEKVVFGVPATAPLQQAFDCGVALALGQGFAREWANRPANHATPSRLADAARALAKLPGLSCKVHGPAEVAKLGMGAFLAVAQGSHEPLRLIELHYQGAAKGDAPVALVGKGITFDTGGISLKPAAEMDEMKFDMGGAASVLGVFRALAELRPQINVVGVIPACENMPDGRAVKPGDVVTSMSGQTIEILNTDAEGRLVLCDALTYVARFKPRAVIDIATLTGACVVALGGLRSGLFSTDEALASALQSAGDQAQDLCWRMPLDDEYSEGLKSNFADMGNVAGRAGGAVTAAKFLQRFVGDLPWAHLDIAGTAWKGGAAKGSTGRPVGLLVHYLLEAAQPAPAAAPAMAVKPPKAQKAPKAGKVSKATKATKASKKAQTLHETAPGAKAVAPAAEAPKAASGPLL